MDLARTTPLDQENTGFDPADYRARLLTVSGHLEEHSLTNDQLTELFSVDFKDLLERLIELKISSSQLQTEDFKEAAEWLFWREINYHYALKLENASYILEFTRLFALEKQLNQVVSRALDEAIERERFSYAHKLLEAYPVFDSTEIKKRCLARYYPIPEGLRGKADSGAFWERILEGEDPSLSLAQAAPILAEKASLLAEDLKTDPWLYWEIKYCLDNPLDLVDRYPHGSGRWTLKRDDYFKPRMKAGDKKKSPFQPRELVDETTEKEAKERNYLRVLYFLGKSDEKRWDQPRIEFHFSVDKKDAGRDNAKDDKFFTTPNIFRFEGLYLGNRRFNYQYEVGLEDGVLIKVDDPKVDFSPLGALKVEKQPLKEMTERLLKPHTIPSEGLSDLRRFGEKWQLPPEEIEELSRAIEEFSIYMYRPIRSDTGACLIIPNRFNYFCSRKFGLELKKARYGEYHPEWGEGMGGYAPYSGTYHEVTVYGGRLVIDWTATQFDKLADKPIPYIYEIGEQRKDFGPLYKADSFESPNVQVINDPKDPLYKEEPPISYDEN